MVSMTNNPHSSFVSLAGHEGGHDLHDRHVEPKCLVFRTSLLLGVVLDGGNFCRSIGPGRGTVSYGDRILSNTRSDSQRHWSGSRSDRSDPVRCDLGGEARLT